MARAPRHSYVLRDTVTSVVFWLGAALGVVLVGDPLLRGDLALVGTTAPIVALVVWVLFLVMFHPHIRYDDERAVVTNIGRVHELPWSRVVTVPTGVTYSVSVSSSLRRWVRISTSRSRVR